LEYEGNLVSLLRNSSEFVRNNSKVRFVKEAQSRVDKPDYADRAIQDRDIHTIASARRNPVIADLFHRMKCMERRGSGLKKILSETAKLPGYDNRLKPKFFCTPSDFRVVLKNVNYSTLANTAQDDRVLLNTSVKR
jgi:ATP-dependent DNA helicase RecG